MQTVRLLLNVRLPEAAHEVEIRVKGQGDILVSLDQSWYSFFLGSPRVSDDFLPARASQHQAQREGL
ncbi:MAG TPA: AbrB/MazE/SpoVT family DNA-binding domain-containing protein [Orrella sp.]